MEQLPFLPDILNSGSPIQKLSPQKAMARIPSLATEAKKVKPEASEKKAVKKPEVNGNEAVLHFGAFCQGMLGLEPFCQLRVFSVLNHSELFTFSRKTENNRIQVRAGF